MTGGLIQIVTKGSGDLFLNGNPEITFFKMIYRRHTNFAIELKRLSFNTSIGFGKTSTINLTKIGDLIHKMYLEVTIPEFYIERTLNTTDINDLTILYNTYLSNYKIIKKFLFYNLEAYRNICQIYDTIDIVTSEKIIDIINNSVNSFESTADYPLLKNIVLTFNPTISTTDKNTNSTVYQYPYRYDQNRGNINLNSVISYFNYPGEPIKTASDILKEESMKIINMIINNCQKLDKDYAQLIIDTKKELDELQSPNYKFAWVNRLGHSIIDYVEFYIGGNKIDKLYGQWLDIWYELTGNKNQEQMYMELIGEVPKLTNYDRTTKPEYKLYIPLQFWFCKYIGLSLPIIALQYSEVFLRFKLRKFSECSYTEMPYQEYVTNGEITTLKLNGTLDNILENKNIDLTANLLVEYVYLDSHERKKFARSIHEYLIDQLQVNYESNLSNTINSLRLDFNHPCKGFVWIIQRENSLINYNNTQKCLWTDYTLENANIPTTYIDENNEIKNTDDSKFNVNPIFNSKLTIYDRDLINNMPSNFFNYVQSYQCLCNSPKEGINSYWFSLKPIEHQPSGSCNCSCVPELKLITEVDPYFFNQSDTYILTIYALNYNILRITNGLGNVAYV